MNNAFGKVAELQQLPDRNFCCPSGTNRRQKCRQFGNCQPDLTTIDACEASAEVQKREAHGGSNCQPDLTTIDARGCERGWSAGKESIGLSPLLHQRAGKRMILGDDDDLPNWKT